jgi:hypothetical protein
LLLQHQPIELVGAQAEALDRGSLGGGTVARLNEAEELTPAADQRGAVTISVTPPL